MKKIECIIRSEKLKDVTDALKQVGAGGMTVSEVRGFGAQSTRPDNFLFVHKTKIEIYALDSQVKERLELELLTLQNFYKGDILFVTHDLAEGYKLASKIAVYESGRIVQCDHKHRVIKSPSNRTVARLTGVRNIMHGSVKQIEGSTVWVTVPELGGDLKIDSEPGLGTRVTVEFPLAGSKRPLPVR